MEIKDILTTQEAASMLGAHIETIRRLARRGGIPAFKIGKDWRYSRTALQQWALDQQTSRRQHPMVLIVEDNLPIVKLMKQLLAPLGCGIVAAHTGKEGLAVTRSQHIDLVLLDLRMPQMNGAEFIARFREDHEETPVIIVTGYPDGELMAEAMCHGPLMLVQKPIDRAVLLRAVKLAIGRQLHAEETPVPALL